MFSQLLFVRLKAAEKALRDGRLDTAYRLATADDLKAHRRASAVLANLAQKYIERAKIHFDADRCREALLDLDRAEAGVGCTEELAALRSNILAVLTEQQRRNQVRRERLVDAVRRVEAGSLAAGRRILEDASERDMGAADLRREIAKREDDAAAIAEQADRLLNQGQHGRAAERIRRVKGLDPHHPATARLESRLCSEVLAHARKALAAGRMAMGGEELLVLGDLAAADPDHRALREALALATTAGGCLRAQRYAEARRHVLALKRLLPEANWLEGTAEQLRGVEELLMALDSGPLGETNRIVHQPVPVAASDALAQTIAVGPRVRQQPIAGGSGLLLLVDGGGSYLLLRGDRTTIGRAASDQPADIVLMGDLAERHAEIHRVDDDYFLIASKEVDIGGRPARHQLLRDGDRLVLGRKAKMNFRLPSRQSASAILDLSDTTRMSNDVRRVVLFQRHAFIGNGPTAHIGCRHAGSTLLLFDRGGSMWIRAKADGHVDTEAKALPMGETVELGGVRLVLAPWRAGAQTNRVL